MEKPTYFWVIGAGMLQVAMIQEARRLGYKVIASDMDHEAPGLGLADVPMIIDTYDDKAHVRAAKEFKDIAVDIAGVATCGADCAYTVSRTARALDLPHLDPGIARKMRDKALVRYDLANDAIGQTFQPWFRFTRVDALLRDHELFDYPCVVKPTTQRASRGVTIVERREILPHALNRVKPYATGGMCLVEGRLTGSEHSAELIFVEPGRPCFFNVVDRVFEYKDGIAMEVGHVNPTRLPTDRQVRIKNMMVHAAKVLGVGWGPFKCDIIYTRAEQSGDLIEPKILEACARLSGGFDCQATTPLSQGRSPIRATIELATGRNPDPEGLGMTRVMAAACCAAFPPPGRVVDIDEQALEDAHAVTGVDAIHLVAKPGDLIEPYEHCATRPAFCIAWGDNYDEAWGRALVAAKIVEEGYITKRED